MNTTTRTLDLNERCKELHERDERFFLLAFTDEQTGKPYEMPEALKRASRRLCLSYGINGICDPMYIANIIAFELGIGDGKSHFKSTP